MRTTKTISALIAALVLTIPQTSRAETVKASFYDCEQPGECSRSKRTASGQKFNKYAMTAAHRTLPLGTVVRVTYKGKSVIVRINDRGPAARTGRGLDLSKGAAARLGLVRVGVARVDVHVLRF